MRIRINKPFRSVGMLGLIVASWVVRGLAWIPRVVKMLLIFLAAIALAIVIGRYYFIIAIVLMMVLYFGPKVLKLYRVASKKMKRVSAYLSH